MSTETPVQHPDKLFIGGAWVAPSGTSEIVVTNSATEEVFLRVAEAQEADVNRAVAAAREDFDRGPWPRLSPEERADRMRAMADELDKRAGLNAVIWTVEAGALHSFTKMRAAGFGNDYRTYAALADTFDFQERHQPKAGGDVALLVREPVGVVAAIVAWNAAAAAIASKVGPALIAGCTVVVKVSPEAPGAAYVLAEACEASGIPPGVVNILTADRAVSELLVRHPGVDKVAFTGSTAAGRRIASICGERIARCTLELGGKSPAIVLDDYDIGTAAKNIASRATFLTGQVCPALSAVTDNPFPSSFSERVRRMSQPTLPNRVLTGLAAALLDGPAVLRRVMVERVIRDGASLAELLTDEDALEAFVRKEAIGVWHASCSCRMGRAEDPMAVVDTQGRVKGVHGLRVVDASIFPVVPRANTNFPTLMAAEKVADAIRARP